MLLPFLLSTLWSSPDHHQPSSRARADQRTERHNPRNIHGAFLRKRGEGLKYPDESFSWFLSAS